MFQDIIDLYKAKSHKYTHKKRVYIKGKPAWRYFYKEHHGKGATHVDDLKEGEAFKVNYNGNEGHFHIDKVDGDNITVIHDETKEKKTLTKRELRAVLLSTHAEALKANVKKKEERFKNAKSEKAKKNAKRRLEQARKKAKQEDNLYTMPETEKKQESKPKQTPTTSESKQDKIDRIELYRALNKLDEQHNSLFLPAIKLYNVVKHHDLRYTQAGQDISELKNPTQTLPRSVSERLEADYPALDTGRGSPKQITAGLKAIVDTSEAMREAEDDVIVDLLHNVHNAPKEPTSQMLTNKLKGKINPAKGRNLSKQINSAKQELAQAFNALQNPLNKLYALTFGESAYATDSIVQKLEEEYSILYRATDYKERITEQNKPELIEALERMTVISETLTKVQRSIVADLQHNKKTALKNPAEEMLEQYQPAQEPKKKTENQEKNPYLKKHKVVIRDKRGNLHKVDGDRLIEKHEKGGNWHLSLNVELPPDPTHPIPIYRDTPRSLSILEDHTMPSKRKADHDWIKKQKPLYIKENKDGSFDIVTKDTI